MAEKRRKHHHKERGHRVISGPQFATHVFGGGWYLGPGWLGYTTAQAATQQAEDAAADAAAPGDSGGTSSG